MDRNVKISVTSESNDLKMELTVPSRLIEDVASSGQEPGEGSMTTEQVNKRLEILMRMFLNQIEGNLKAQIFFDMGMTSMAQGLGGSIDSTLEYIKRRKGV